MTSVLTTLEREREKEREKERERSLAGKADKREGRMWGAVVWLAVGTQRYGGGIESH